MSVPVLQCHSRVAKPIAQLLCQLSYLASYSGNNCSCYGEMDGVTYRENGVRALGLKRSSYGPCLFRVEGGGGGVKVRSQPQNEIDVWG